MKTKLFAVILAGLLLLTATACTGDGGDATDTSTDTTGTPIIQTNPVVTDKNGNTVTDTNGNAVTEAPNKNQEVENTEFNEFTGTVYVGIGVNIREQASATSNKLGTAAVGTTFKATRENNKWYEITYEGKTAYVSKNAVVDNAIIESMEEINDKVVVTAETSLNLRKIPSGIGEASIVTAVNNSDVLNRIAVGDGWSKVLYTDKSGNTTECYVSNTYIKSLNADATETTTTAPETTEAPTEAETFID